jgi:hypothetical protein
MEGISSCADDLERRGHHLFARLETGLDPGVLPAGAEHANASHVETVFLVHHPDLTVAAQRCAGQLEDVLHEAPFDLRVHEQAHRQRRPLAPALAIVGVVDPGHDVDHARACVERTLGAHHVTGPAVELTRVLGTESHRGSVRGLGLRCGVRLAQLGAGLRRGTRGRFPVVAGQVEKGEVGIADGEPHLCVVDGVDARERLAAAYVATHVDVLGAHAAREGGADLAALEVELGTSHRHPGLADACLGARLGVGGVVEGLPARRAARAHGALALQDGAGQRQVALRPRQGSLGALERDLVVARVDSHQHVVLCEQAARCEIGRDPHDAAGDLADQLTLGARLHGALGTNAELHRAESRASYLDERRHRRRAPRLGGRLVDHHRQRDGAGDEEHYDRSDDLGAESHTGSH